MLAPSNRATHWNENTLRLFLCSLSVPKQTRRGTTECISFLEIAIAISRGLRIAHRAIVVTLVHSVHLKQIVTTAELYVGERTWEDLPNVPDSNSLPFVRRLRKTIWPCDARHEGGSFSATIRLLFAIDVTSIPHGPAALRWLRSMSDGCLVLHKVLTQALAAGVSRTADPGARREG